MCKIPQCLQGYASWVQEIHLFWFGEQDIYEETYEHLFSRWYRGGPRLAQEILTRFGPRLEEVQLANSNGTLTQWRQGPRADVAFIILLDQMTRKRMLFFTAGRLPITCEFCISHGWCSQAKER